MPLLSGMIREQGHFVPYTHIYAMVGIEDDFEGNGNINTWSAIDCVINTNWPNPLPQGINNSNRVLRYSAMEVDYIRIYQKNSVGAGENEAGTNIKAYPIPAQDQITLELHKAINGRVLFEVYDGNGAFVYAQHLQVENGRAQLHGLGALQSGMYLITFEKDGFRGAVKFVK